MRRRVVLAFTALAVWAAGSALGSLGPVAPAAALTPAIIVGKAHADYAPALDGSRPIFILALGSDAREGTPVDRGLSDSIHIVAINLAKHKVTILGFPRDSWVNIPGYGSDKINSAMPRGGPQLTVQTVEQLTGIKLDYYVLTSFTGVENAYNGVGGLTMDVPFPMHDTYSHADLNAGVQKLKGNAVLAFSRDRHSVYSGDFGRSEDQGRVLVASLMQLRKEYAKDPSRIFDYIGAGMQNVQTDLSISEVIDWAFTALTINPKHVANVVVPGTTAMQGTKSVVVLSPNASTIYSDLGNDGILSKKTLKLAPSPTLDQPGCCS